MSLETQVSIILGVMIGSVLIGIFVVIRDVHQKSDKNPYRVTAVLPFVIFIVSLVYGMSVEDKLIDGQADQVLDAVVLAEKEVALRQGKGTDSVLDLQAVSPELTKLLEKHDGFKVTIDYGDLAEEVEITISVTNEEYSRIAPIGSEMTAWARKNK